MVSALLAASLVFTPADAGLACTTAVQLVERHTPRDPGTARSALAANFLLDAASAAGADVRRDVFFAKTPKDWTYRLPRKALQVAANMAMAEKVRGERVKVIDAIALQDPSVPKTKEIAATLTALDLARTVLVVVDQYDKNTYLSVRNIPKAKILPVSDLNAYEILRPYQLLVTKSALDKFVETRVGK